MSITSPYSLANLVFAQAAKHRDRVAVATMNDAVSYERLQVLMTNCALHMKRHGIDRSSCLALDIEHPLIAFCLALACSLVGCSWVEATKAADEQTVFKITHVLHDGAKPYPGEENLLRVDAAWFVPPPGSNRRMRGAFTGYQTPRDTWMIGQSSGTTGTPKFMAFDEEIAWSKATEPSAAAWLKNPVTVSLFSAISAGGMATALRGLAVGGTTIFGYFKDFTTSIHVDCVYGAPSHFAEMLDGAPPPKTRIPVAIIGGSAVSQAFFARMLRYFGSVSYLYGSSEASTICTNVITDMTMTEENTSVGIPRDGIRLEIVNIDNAPLPAGREGIVRLWKTPQVTHYIGDPETNARVFYDGWFYPGDLGFLSDTGKLYITGRANDQLNIGGVKLNPVLVDEQLRSHPDIGDGACFADVDEDGNERLAAALVLATPRNPVRAARSVYNAVRPRLSSSAMPSAFYFLEALPRNPNGKLTRHLLAAAVRDQTPILIDKS